MSEPLKVLGVQSAAEKNPSLLISLLVRISSEWDFSSHFPLYFLVINPAKTTSWLSVKIYRGFSEVLWLSFWDSGISLAHKSKFQGSDSLFQYVHNAVFPSEGCSGVILILDKQNLKKQLKKVIVSLFSMLTHQGLKSLRSY